MLLLHDQAFHQLVLSIVLTLVQGPQVRKQNTDSENNFVKLKF